jgi:hypothetical protein
MRRAICLFSLFCFSSLLVGCDGDAVNDNTATSPTEAKALAEQLPKPDFKGTSGKKK